MGRTEENGKREGPGFYEGEAQRGRLETGRGSRECQASIINTFVKINRSGSKLNNTVHVELK